MDRKMTPGQITGTGCPPVWSDRGTHRGTQGPFRGALSPCVPVRAMDPVSEGHRDSSVVPVKTPQRNQGTFAPIRKPTGDQSRRCRLRVGSSLTVGRF